MASGTTRRTALNTIWKKALLWPKTTDADTLSADLHAIAEALENDAETGEGKVAERPAAALRGRLFYVTEGSEKGLWWDNGSAWLRVAELLAEQVTESAIAAEAVSAAKVKAEAIETSKIKAGAVTAAKLGGEAVETAKIKTGAVTAEKLGAEAVETAKIASEAVTGPKLGSETLRLLGAAKYEAYKETDNDGLEAKVSATRPAQVLVDVNVMKESTAELFVDGVKVSELWSDSNTTVRMAFPGIILQPGQYFKVQAGSGSLEKIHYTFMLL